MKKTVLDRIAKCYSVNAVQVGGRTKLLFAGEGDGSLRMYEGEGFSQKTVLWSEEDGLGGTMSISAAPDFEGYFFVSTGFFTMIHSETSSIWLMRWNGGSYDRVKVCDIPYLHRFDVLLTGKRRYLIACTIHSGKQSPEDWSRPGKVLVAELPLNLDEDVSVHPRVLVDGLFQNHGFNCVEENGASSVLVASRNGILRVTPPQCGSDDWRVENVADFPASDVCALDLDGDGVLEYGVISPFHGDKFSVYKSENGKLRKIYEHEKPLDFYHAIHADAFLGIPSFIIGARKLDMDLYRVFCRKDGEVVTELIESGAGSSNAKIVHTENGDLILSANRQKDEAAFYKA